MISIGQMEKIAEAMGGRFVYAIVPDRSVEEMISKQARRKARSKLLAADMHMALERQGASVGELDRETDRLGAGTGNHYANGFLDLRPAPRTIAWKALSLQPPNPRQPLA